VKSILLFFCFFSSIYLFGQGAKQTYEAPNLKQTLSTHKIVAILPFRVTISYKKMPKNFDPAGNLQQEKEEGLNMQQGMYTYLLRKANDYTTTFQDVDRTNTLLKNAGVFDKIDDILPDSLCKILKIDAVIKCSYSYERTASEAGAIAKTMVFGFGGSTASGALTMQINNGTDGTLLWHFYKEMSEGAFTSANQLMERMMKKVSRNFPYEK
jgi:hypothetical protein